MLQTYLLDLLGFDTAGSFVKKYSSADLVTMQQDGHINNPTVLF